MLLQLLVISILLSTQMNLVSACNHLATHLSLASASDEMVVTWTSNVSLPAIITWNTTDPDGVIKQQAKAKANTTAFTVNVHRATITNLTVGSVVTYWFVAEDDSTTNAPCIFSFTFGGPHIQKQIAASTSPTTVFAIYGDLGVKEQEGANWTLSRLRMHVEKDELDLVVHVGDIAYDLAEENGWRAQEFLNDMMPVASAVPYMTTPGNHERECWRSSNKTCSHPPYTSYRVWFNMPNKQQLFWSKDIGHTHLISLNTDAYLYTPQVDMLRSQLAWLRADLVAASSNRANVPWIVAFGHEMMYSSHDAAHVKQAATIRSGGASGVLGLEDLFYEFGVDLYFSGHEHVYERFGRTYRSQINQKGTSYIVVGNAGNREFPYMNGTHVRNFSYPMPSYEKARSPFPAGYGLLEVNESTLEWTQMSSRTGRAIDSFVFQR